jgi:hypothetical protein
LVDSGINGFRKILPENKDLVNVCDYAGKFSADELLQQGKGEIIEPAEDISEPHTN